MRRSPTVRRFDLKKIALWITACGLAMLGMAFAADAIVRDWRQSVRESQTMLADTGPVRQYHGADSTEEAEAATHNRFTLGELMTPDRRDRPRIDTSKDAAPAYPIQGTWSAATGVENIVADHFRDNCPYAIVDLKLNLRASEDRVFGFGNYSLSSVNCQGGESDVVVYVTVKGTFDSPFVKLIFTDSQSAREEFRFFGTARPEGILGQIRSPDGRLLVEHVVLESL